MMKKFIIYGRVQGVGFRFFTYREALKLGIRGTVKNCLDGSVEVIAEGSEVQLDAFYQWLKIGPRSAKVEKVIIRDCSSLNFEEFSILR
ncbi:acylphosphatase [Rodentibacter caecimuris]|uniref:acylphosphatase n=1 Tax=Rodentibacter caecimuris TaxID=1796644 RepID=A0ABX3KY89_9PAST|nr:acylphosphatase [Rodentibacter heylii]